MSQITDYRLRDVDCFWRAANYLGAAELYLMKNALLRHPLSADDIKPRLLGHWGTQPGINFIYAHLNRLIQDTDSDLMLVVGPGHGSPAVIASLYLEGTLSEFYPEYTFDEAGVDKLARDFCWPYGFPSHLYPGIPGAIQEGGELGYCLSHAFGAALDNPDLIVACIVGDGEAETGPLAASWQSNKFLDPAGDGAVLPILHDNGDKLSGPTLMGRMTDAELEHYFTGLGYRVRLVAGDDPKLMHPAMWEALDWAHEAIRALQRRARQGDAVERPAWPLIVLKTPKGWTGPKYLDGLKIEGTYHSHQIPIPDPKENPKHLRAVEEWLRSYRPEELFDAGGAVKPGVRAIAPKGDKRMGMSPHANGGSLLVPLELPDFRDYAVDVPAPGAATLENTREGAKYIRDIFRRNAAQKNFRFMCPDETTSNKMDPVFEATDRVFEWPIDPADEHMSPHGRVMEVLSEHDCEGWLEGYLMSGRHGIFACYEAFIPIVDSMVNQFAKWLKVAREIPWRSSTASMNYLLTSHVWRQDHNGYSHQVPSFLSEVANKKSSVARIYLPPDANTLLSALDHCFRSRDYVNLIVSSKNAMPQWLSMSEAVEHAARGIGIWHWAGNAEDAADVVLAGAGDVPMLETIAAAWLLQRELPELRVRVVNVMDLFTLMSHKDHPHGIDQRAFEEIFGVDIPVIFAFHGYPKLVHELIWHGTNPGRFHVHGYNEEGRTTTPFDMLVLNQMSRYDLAIAALERVPRLRSVSGEVTELMAEKLRQHRRYIGEHDLDMPEVRDWMWSLPGKAAAETERARKERAA